MRAVPLVLAALLASGAAWAEPPTVACCTLEGMVDAGSSAYLVDCVERAQQAEHSALLVRLDTPGGELESTRAIVRAFLRSEVPVLVWVGPAGARAGSAGVFLTLSSHLAGMAPGTNIGAAHPVLGSGQDPEAAGGEHLARKIENDTIAFARSIATERGRNADWAEAAVRESESVPAEQALKLKVIEVVAPTEEAFLQAAEGRQVVVGGEERRLRVAGAQVVELEPSLGQRLLHALAQPAVVYVLFLVAALGIGVELSNPGLGVPGLVGLVSLVLALLGSSALPVRMGAVALLLLGAGLLVAELFVASGVAGAVGVVLLVLGGIFLVDRVDPDWFVDRSVALPLQLVVPTAVVLGAVLLALAWRVAQARRLPQRVGDVGLVGEQGAALGPIDNHGGEAFVHGERWQAVSSAPIAPGARVVVRGVQGLTLLVDEVAT